MLYAALQIIVQPVLGRTSTGSSFPLCTERASGQACMHDAPYRDPPRNTVCGTSNMQRREEAYRIRLPGLPLGVNECCTPLTR